MMQMQKYAQFISSCNSNINS